MGLIKLGLDCEDESVVIGEIPEDAFLAFVDLLPRQYSRRLRWFNSHVFVRELLSEAHELATKGVAQELNRYNRTLRSDLLKAHGAARTHFHNGGNSVNLQPDESFSHILEPRVRDVRKTPLRLIYVESCMLSEEGSKNIHEAAQAYLSNGCTSLVINIFLVKDGITGVDLPSEGRVNQFYYVEYRHDTVPTVENGKVPFVIKSFGADTDPRTVAAICRQTGFDADNVNNDGDLCVALGVPGFEVTIPADYFWKNVPAAVRANHVDGYRDLVFDLFKIRKYLQEENEAW
jgi:hypothetical protein